MVNHDYLRGNVPYFSVMINKFYNKKMYLTRIILGVVVLFVLYGFPGGITTQRRAGAPGGEGTCRFCHSSSGDSQNVGLSGMPSFYEAGKTYDLNLRATHPGGVVGGFQIVATNGLTRNMVGEFKIDQQPYKFGIDLRLNHGMPIPFINDEVNFDFQWKAPDSGGPKNVVFYFAVNAANGDGNTSGDFIYASNSGQMALPLEFVYFEVNTNDSRNELKWATENEINVSHFVIQRSVDGISFDDISEVEAASATSSPNQYRYIDKESPFLEDQYYRIKQVDFDGSYQFSMTIQSDGKLISEPMVNIYPNPIFRGQDIHLQISEQIGEPIEVEIYNINGHIEFRSIVEVNQPNHLIINSLSNISGIYYVQLKAKERILSRSKLMVLD